MLVVYLRVLAALGWMAGWGVSVLEGSLCQLVSEAVNGLVEAGPTIVVFLGKNAVLDPGMDPSVVDDGKLAI